MLRDEMTEDRSVFLNASVKETAVRLILTREVSCRDLAKDLGIGMPIISRWVRDAIDESPYGEVLECLHDEVGMLRKKNAELQKLLAGRTSRVSSNDNDSESAA